MLFATKTGHTIELRFFTLADTDALLTYLHQLSNETKQRFGPHSFDAASIQQLYQQPANHLGFIAFDTASTSIIAYSIIKIGFLQHDQQRLESYGLQLSQTTDCTFAPSVADASQSSSVGTAMLQFIKEELKQTSIQRIILWGGVQAGNEKAVNYYLKHQFRILGEFEYNGKNYDMVFDMQKQ